MKSYVMCEGVEKIDIEEVDLRNIYIYVLKCPACDGYNVIRENDCVDREYFDFLIDHDTSYDLQEWNDLSAKASYTQESRLYPPSRRLFYNLPEAVEKSYRTALRLLTVEPLACAVFIGRTLEFMAKERKAAGKTLEKMLEDLKNKGEIPDPILQIAHSIRFFRNIGAHADSEADVSRQDATTLLALCEAILEYVYEAPAMLQKAQEKADALKTGVKPKQRINLRGPNPKRDILLDEEV